LFIGTASGLRVNLSKAQMYGIEDNWKGSGLYAVVILTDNAKHPVCVSSSLGECADAIEKIDQLLIADHQLVKIS